MGRHAEQIVSNHPLTPCLGEASPLGRLYDLDAKVLLLGVDHCNNTSAASGRVPSHLAEQAHLHRGRPDHG